MPTMPYKHAYLYEVVVDNINFVNLFRFQEMRNHLSVTEFGRGGPADTEKTECNSVSNMRITIVEKVDNLKNSS